MHPQLAMATLGTLFGGIGIAMRKDPAQKPTQPPINASSKDEEAFIQYVVTQLVDLFEQGRGFCWKTGMLGGLGAVDVDRVC